MAKSSKKAEGAPDGTLEITVKSPKGAAQEGGTGEATVQYNFGANLQEALEKFGEEVVFTTFVRMATINLQAIVRGVLDRGGSADDAVAAAAAWTPGVSRRAPGVKKDPIKQAAEAIKTGKMSKDDVIAALEAALAEG